MSQNLPNDRSHRGAALTTLGLALASCQAQPALDPSAIAMPRTISQSFDLREIRRGTHTELSPKQTLVDYQSTIIVRPRREDLARLIGVDMAAKPSLSRAEVERINRDIQAATDALDKVGKLSELVDLIADYERLTIAFQARELAASTLVQVDKMWRELKTTQAKIVNGLKDLAMLYVDYRDHAGSLDWTSAMEDEAIEDQVAQINALLSPGGKAGTIQLFSHEVVSRYLNLTTVEITKRLQALADLVLEKAPEAMLDIEAHLRRGSERVPVSIPPYMIVDGAERGQKSPRVGIPSKQDLEKVKRSYDAYAKLSTSINELRDLAGDQQQLDRLKSHWQQAFKSARESLEQGLEAQLSSIINANAELGVIKLKAATLQDDLDALQRSWKLFAQDMPMEPIALAQAATELLTQLRDTPLKTHLEELLGSLNMLPNDLEPAVRELLLKAKQEVAVAKDELLKSLTMDGVPGSSSLASAVGALGALHAIASTETFGNLQPGKITANPINLRASEDGAVDLNQTVAESGDQLEIVYTLTKGPSSNAQEQRKYVASESFDVRKFGYYTTLKSQILFYDRLNDGSSTYSAAPGISYNLHYLPEDHQSFFDTVAPGVGLSVSAPNYENGTELAIGAQLTLFNDMLMIGYAHNISVDSNQGMFFFGLDLIGAFQGLQ